MWHITRTHQYAALAISALLVLGPASARVASNSVGSKQVRNDSLKSIDIRDGTLQGKDLQIGALGGREIRDGGVTAGDLSPGAVPELYSFQGRVTADGVQRTVLTIPGFSRFKITCNSVGALESIFAEFGPNSVPGQSHGIYGSDLADNNPVGAATVSGSGGGVGLGASGTSPSTGIIFQGGYWGQSSTLDAFGTWSVGYPSSTCLVRIMVTVKRYAASRANTPARIAPSAPAPETTCLEETGTGFCRLD